MRLTDSCVVFMEVEYRVLNKAIYASASSGFLRGSLTVSKLGLVKCSAVNKAM